MASAPVVSKVSPELPPPAGRVPAIKTQTKPAVQDQDRDQEPAASARPTLAKVAQEVLAQAQAQWSMGDRAGAMLLVRDLLARWPRDDVENVGVLAQAVREHARMTLSQDRPADVLAMLVQWEKPLAQVADIWALRGNTAQRLGLHAQAVHAYMQALELSPGQARWMLAAAVSLAAQGQSAPAAEWAEKARRSGFLPADVANYLQQLGVVLQAP